MWERWLCYYLYTIMTVDIADGQMVSSQKKVPDVFQRNTRASRVSCSAPILFEVLVFLWATGY